jgi:GH43 family beta-xylosidase
LKIGVPAYSDNILHGQDPWVIPHNKSFLLVQSVNNDSEIKILQFKDYSLTKKESEAVVWSPSDSDHSKLIWAPELHRFSKLSGKWYIYYAACDGKNANHRMYVLESDTEDPFGPYHDLGKITDPSDQWAIDMTVLEYQGRLYAIWSGWENSNDVFPQNLYIAPMKNPWTISGKRICISRPEFDWEKSVAAINEGPQVLINDDRLFIVYSANASWTQEYKLGLLSLEGKDILNPNSWEKYPKPVFEKGTTNIYGPGHASFIKASRKNYIVYHHKTNNRLNWKRAIKVKEFEWASDGLPSFGLPL